ncbi:MAG: hypothetical protein A2848_03365 [Candidatus Magasanikbacteria bacterium RIFCSPHIGHO2_01_FULL_50_8]|uniref:Isopenicillin N synthase-like Fe(2+) 2OG dioxygenase domain-containing protein n=1 Tax=Candidatus Magasanikbacteria bacterium RIFCSPHIGHO2_01_FULL_50_8 TaxID=1798674 RepID=A0A1F6LNA4_9BACT|nr:MAG: hypothetical protein A2848_03365 [Candidatus Magasanikbacteria bacterium RIFCSPHIGHO2_01_FULL_50_8]
MSPTTTYRHPSKLPVRSTRTFDGVLDPIDIHVPTAPFMLVQDLLDFGAVCVRTRTFGEEHNQRGLRAAQRYFCRPYEQRMRDVPPPELAFQVGLTPRGQEKTRQRYEHFDHLPREHRPTEPRRNGAMSERLMFPVGSRPAQLDSRFLPLNSIHANPAGVTPFADDLRACGESLIEVGLEVVRLLEIGLMLPEGRLQQLSHAGPHLLAPNATHLDEGVDIGDVANEVHYDLNMITLFGKSNAPGLYVWIDQKYRCSLSIPDGCVLVQAGKQLTWMTGGYINYGLHEVVATQQMFDVLTHKTPVGMPRVRTSLPLFFHVNSMQLLEPLDHLVNMPQANEYPRMLAGDYLFDELRAINLATV